MSGMVSTVLHALRHFRALVITQSLNIGLTVALTVALFFINRLTVLPALLVGVVTAAAAAGLGFVLLPAGWRASITAGGELHGQESRRLLSFSKWLWLSAILSVMSSQLDLLLLNRWLAPQFVGLYALALNLAFKVNIVNQSLRAVLLPTVSALSGKAAFVGYARRSLARSLLVVVALVAALPLAGPFILVVYGADYAASIDVFYLLMTVVLFDLLTVPFLLLAFPMNMPRLITAADAARVVALLVTGSLLIPAWGMHGAVLAKLAAAVAGALVIGLAIVLRLRNEVEPATGIATAPDTSSAPYPPPPDAT